MSRDQTVFVDGVKVTLCAYRKPRKSERTFDIDKSKYTPWAQTVAKYVRGSGGVIGTVEKIPGFGIC